MPDALECFLVLVWLAQTHRVRKASDCLRVPPDLRQGVLFCLFIALVGQPPNRPMQSTPLRVHKIRAILNGGIGPSVFPLYRWRRG